MLKLDRICVIILMLGVTLLVPSIARISFIDELCAYSMLAIALADCIFNGNWGRYKLLWVIMGVLTFYAVYSITQLKYNTTPYILLDWITELKPFVPFCVTLAIAPRLNRKDRHYIKTMCVINTVGVTLLMLPGDTSLLRFMLVNSSYGGQIAFISAALYLYCSIDEYGHVTRRVLKRCFFLLSTGLLCFKAKFYATYVLALYFFALYKPGVMRHFSAKHAVVVILVICGVIGASWSKFEYYFLTGNQETFDPKVVESFARPVLYFTGATILADHFPFGTGLASFATSASEKHYSMVYYEYGIHNVHGLSQRSEASFICDSFYPSLAQYGAAGLALFIYFWIYVYGYLRKLIRRNPQYYKYQFIIGSLIICFILIESSAATTFTHNSGVITMFLLGMICSEADRIKDPESAGAEESNQTKSLRKI